MMLQGHAPYLQVGNAAMQDEALDVPLNLEMEKKP